MTYTFNYIDDNNIQYYETVRKIHFEGEEITVRGQRTKEILDAVTVFNNPYNRCIMIPQRKWNPWTALGESLWVLACSNKVEDLLPFNIRAGDYSDDGKNLYGGYGPRIYATLNDALELMKKDIHTRRAVVPIFSREDVGTDSKDIPCNTSLMFKARNNELHLAVTNRSNDVNWGLYGVNKVQFSIILEVVADLLGLDMGHQTHFSHSLHYYLDNPSYFFTEQFLKMGTPTQTEHFYDKFNPLPIGVQNLTLDKVMNMADAAIHAQTTGHKWFDIAAMFLGIYDRTNHKKMIKELADFKNHYNMEFGDWIKAGEMFLGELKDA